MSRIGYKVVELPEKVEFNQDGDQLTVKGPKGTLSTTLVPEISVKSEGNVISFEPAVRYTNKVRALHGTMRANFNNIVEGVTNGFSKTLKLIGVGYRTQLKGKTLVLNVGYSNPVDMEIPEDIEVKVPDNTTIEISGINNQHVGDFAAKVRAVRSPEPYKGKGIRYENEYVRRLEGKTGK